MVLEYPEVGLLCCLWVQWADSRTTYRRKSETVTNHVIREALIFVLYRFTSPERSNGHGTILERDDITLGGKIIISLTSAGKKRHLPIEKNKRTYRQTNRQRRKHFPKQIFVDSVGYFKVCSI